MSRAEKYQRFAEECMELAKTAKLHMAQVCLRLDANQTTETEREEAS
jgi:hypothetical protein